MGHPASVIHSPRRRSESGAPRLSVDTDDATTAAAAEHHSTTCSNHLIEYTILLKRLLRFRRQALLVCTDVDQYTPQQVHTHTSQSKNMNKSYIHTCIKINLQNILCMFTTTTVVTYTIAMQSSESRQCLVNGQQDHQVQWIFTFTYNLYDTSTWKRYHDHDKDKSIYIQYGVAVLTHVLRIN